MAALSSRRGGRFRLRRIVLVMLTGLASLFLLAAIGVALAGLRDHPGRADLAVVLGNEVLGDGHPSDRLAARLDRALELYQAGDCTAVLVSGGPEPNGFDEGTVMAAYLAARGVPADRLLRDSAGINTYATARNTRDILRAHGWRSVCVVTQFYHVPRSRLAMRRFGIDPVYGVHAHYWEWPDFFSTAREVAGLVKYSLRSYPATPPGTSVGLDGKGHPISGKSSVIQRGREGKYS